MKKFSLRSSRMKKTFMVLALMLVPLFLSACFGGGSSTSSTSGDVLSKVQTMYGEVTVKKPTGGKELRVVALGWSDAEAALALGIKPVGVVDWLSFGDKDKGVGPWATSRFGSDTPVVMPRPVDESFNYEQIQSLKPDVILDTNGANDQKVFERLSQIAPTIFPPAGTKPWVFPWDAQQKLVGEALGLASKGDELVAKTKKLIEENRKPEFASVRGAVAVYFGGTLGVYLPGDPRWDLLAALGFTLDPRIKALSTGAFYIKIPTDKISLLDTGVMVLLAIGDQTDNEVKANPLISSLKIARDNRIVYATKMVMNAFSAGSVLSIPVALKDLMPDLEAAAKKAKAEFNPDS